MDYKEAIERVKDHMVVHRIQEDRAIKITEALMMAIDAMKKQIPKESNYKTVVADGYDWETGDDYKFEDEEYYCPICGEYLCNFALYGDGNYCKKCGQKIDWEQ